ncbi:hypothetical protein BDV29DRAFT_174739 [Aspergillus leporis]|uniref:Uncharacterized protein n=1 Tax=Aspergillus leporis TaxID=41062 RepID=A0A5N5X345_9EURO|nr:hypothetical protein BDV29DRAFT_174739 [Aspergillus leporis]
MHPPPPSKLTYHQHPTPIHDTLARLDWVLQNLQPKRLGIIGTHIGGSLAPMLALTAAQSINAVAALEPICDWTGLDEYCVRSTDDCNAVSKKRGKERDSSPRDLVPLLKARERFFATPERYFDAFASPILFLRDPGMDVPRTFPEYLTGSGYPVPVLKPGVLRGGCWRASGRCRGCPDTVS